MTRPMIVTVTPFLQFDSVPHAGGRYLVALERALARAGLSQLSLAPETPSNREAVMQPGCPPHVLLGPPAGPGPATKAARRTIALADGYGRRLDPGLPNVPFALALRRPEVRRRLAAASVVDLQWSESIRLARRIRQIAPHARLVGTFHDVQSQLFRRESERTGQSAAAVTMWRLQARTAAAWERRGVKELDDIVVFSEKDAELLPPADTPIHILRPPMTPEIAPRHVQPQVPIVLVVSYLAREENQDAATWLLTEIWPLVRARVPEAKLRLAGGGAPPHLGQLARSAGADMLGFVDDLAAEYAAASVALVPVRTGAGVKFKTIEALSHGVPVVATPTGAEGVTGPAWKGPFPETAEAVADELVAVLQSSTRAQERANELQTWAMATFGFDTFAKSVLELYG